MSKETTAQQTTDIMTVLTNIDGKTVGDVMAGLYSHINNFVAQYGAEAWNGILLLMQVKSIWDLAIGIIIMIIGVLLITKVQTRMHSEYENSKLSENGRKKENGDGFYIIGFFASWVIGVILVFVSLFAYILNFTLWLTAFAPELGLAYRVLTKVVSF